MDTGFSQKCRVVKESGSAIRQPPSVAGPGAICDARRHRRRRGAQWPCRGRLPRRRGIEGHGAGAPHDRRRRGGHRGIHPGFRNSVAAYTVSLLNPKIIRDLDLAGHGLRIVERPLSNFLPLPDGRYLKAAPGRTKAEVAKFSARDAERLDVYEARLERVADVLRDIALATPPNVATGQGLIANLAGLLDTAKVANRLRSLGIEGQRDLVEVFARSAGDFLDQWFESDPIKAILGFDGIVGTYAEPLRGGHGLRAPAPLLGRDERQKGRLGPCDRRHGRDH